MIVDTSAIMAILMREEDEEIYIDALAAAPVRRISGANFVELAIVADRKDNPIPVDLAEEFIHAANIRIEPMTHGQIVWARIAHIQFGRGRHAAGLNFGDRFAYALARETGEPLLFKGGDFARTDITPAI